jgi:hypothetical protein
MAGVDARERRLVLACLLRPTGADLAPLTSAGTVDWKAVLVLARRYAVLEPLAHALLGETRAALPPPVRDRLEEASAAAAARNALLLHDLARAQALLRDAGVRSAALKGAALLVAHAPSLAVRHLSDVDLLVGPADLPRAADILAAAGIVPPAGTLPALDGGTGPLARNPGTAHVRAIETWGGMLLELHDRLPGGGPPAEEVVAAARARTVGGQPLDVSAPDDLAGMLCRHVVLVHGADARLRARHVADLAWLEPELDWARVEARYGGDRSGRGALRLSRELLSAAQREADAGERAPARLALLEPVPNAVLAQLARGVSTALDGPLRTAFPARRYMEARFGLKPGSPWTPLLYPWRLVSGLVRRLSGKT